MIIHSQFTVPSTRYAWLAGLLNSKEVFDGGFARVVPYSAKSVIKATSCTATNLLFQELLDRAKQGLVIPANLPAVLKKHGKVAADKEGISFNVWEIERLFEPTDIPGMRVARATSRHNFSGLKPEYSLERVTKTALAQLVSLTAALKREQDYFGGAGDWLASAHIAQAMVLQTSASLRDTFVFLQDFVIRNKVCLDLLGAGNLLVNMFGVPCLSDAVCDVYAADLQTEYKSKGGLCVGCEVPIRVQGLHVHMQSRASFPLIPAEASQVQQACTALGLAPRIFQWDSPALQKYLASKVKVLPIWDIPLASKRLKTDEYSKIFAN